MKRSGFTAEQIIASCASPTRHEPAIGSSAMPPRAKTAAVCRRHGINCATFYAPKAKFGGGGPSEAKRLKASEDENAKLKWCLAEAPDSIAQKDLLARNGDARRQARGCRQSRTELTD